MSDQSDSAAAGDEQRRLQEEQLLILREAVDRTLAGITAIQEMGCFDNIPPEPEAKRVHNIGMRLLDMIEASLRHEVARVWPR